jgi:signal peptidase I
MEEITPMKRQPKAAQKKNDESFARWLWQTLALTIVFIGVVFALFTFILSNNQVSGISMQPTFESGDRLIALRHTQIHRGDIVVLKAPDRANTLYIKRVIGMPGDTLASKDDVMYINGKEYAQPFLDDYKAQLPTGILYTDNFSLQSRQLGDKVPADSYFVMGDHRNSSRDSRVFGYVKKSAIVGVVKWRYWPINQMRGF